MIEAKTERVTDSPNANERIFNPAGLNPMGVGPVMEVPVMIRSNLPGANASLQVVVVHGMVSPEGHLDETQVLASTDPNLNAAAVNHASTSHFIQPIKDMQPGTTPLSREAIFTVEFEPLTPCSDVPSPGNGPGVGCSSRP